MTERRKDLLFIGILLAVLIAFFSKILFTHQIIRAPDIIAEFYWGIKHYSSEKFLDLFKVTLTADWSTLVNSGTTVEGGSASAQLLLLRNLVFGLIPLPENVAWYIVLHLFFGAAGTYFCCRVIGASRVAALLGGLIFALAPENATLINAGHVMKLATISFAPWAFYFLEKGFQTRRIFYFLVTAFTLAFQFFHTHWQVAYYTCLAIGVYGIARSIGILVKERPAGKEVARLVGLNVTLLVFFLSTVAISLAPLSNWAKDTNRGGSATAVSASAGTSSQPSSGMSREEAMSWSMPPEETAAFIIPGMFGYSRQEAGDNPKNITSFYWGRMNFTQTLSYMGLLPWLLLPLPLIFRRNRYTWLALAAIVVGVFFSMGKYTPFYNFLFDYFPGINRFRVPKMIMFIPVLGLGVLSALGLDLLLDPAVRATRAFRRYLLGIFLLPVALLVVMGIEVIGKNFWIERLIDIIGQPTRYEQGGPELILQRWGNLVMETGIAAWLSALFAATFFLFQRGRLGVKALPLVLLALYLADVGRVNAKFMFLVDEPQQARGVKTPETTFLADKVDGYRVLPMNGDPMVYVSENIPVMFTSNAVQQRRWQDFLDTFTLGSSMPDLINLRFLVESKEQYEQDKTKFDPARYVPVFQSPTGSVIVENRQVLPKAWLVPTAAVVTSPQETLGIMQNPAFNPRQIALVESPPTIQIANANANITSSPGTVKVVTYRGEKIELEATATANCMLVMGEKYNKGWKATVDGQKTEVYPVDYILRGIYLTPGSHKIQFVFDPTPFKVGKILTLASFVVFAAFLARELLFSRKRRGEPEAASEATLSQA
ncbi:MAG TPA: YfhO family protein [Geomonas sp.]|nr:YfhO family protein [Geomonas sp.]